MTYTKLQNYTNVVVGEHGIQIYKVMIVVLILLLLSFDVLSPTSASSLLFMAKWLVHIYTQMLVMNSLVTINNPLHLLANINSHTKRM